MFFGGDPFEHFAHAGMGGGGSRRTAASRDVDTTKLYETLGVSTDINIIHVIYLAGLLFTCAG
jgi:hypothetical protein